MVVSVHFLLLQFAIIDDINWNKSEGPEKFPKNDTDGKYLKSESKIVCLTFFPPTITIYFLERARFRFGEQIYDSFPSSSVLRKTNSNESVYLCHAFYAANFFYK